MMTDDNKTPEESPAVETTTTTTQPPQKSPVSMQRTESGGVATDFGSFHLEVEAKQVPLVGYFLASFIFMIASLAQKQALRNWFGYAVTIGVLGMVVALAGLVLLKYKSELDQKYLAYAMVVWAIVGACLMTFGSGPFTVTGNGYFAVWGMVIFAVMHCGATDKVKDGMKGLSSLAGLGLASIVMIVAISYEVGINQDRGNSIYTLTLSCLSVCLALGFMYLDKNPVPGFKVIYRFVILAVFAIMWIVAACLVTFDGPFIKTGNGYFTAWAAAILAVFAALGAKQQMKHDESPV